MSRRAFTLMGALVVMGILGLLAALVFGLMAPAREKGRQAVCAGNLRHWGQAYRMYAQDWDAREPEVGVRMEYYEVGLPSNCWAFRRMYGLEAVATCPSDTRPRTAGHHPVYTMPGCRMVHHAEDFPGWIATMGPRFALMKCNSHNGGYRLTDQSQIPSWYRFRILILRYDQSLAWKTVAIPKTTDMFLD